jgi:hypothetical protein
VQVGIGQRHPVPYRGGETCRQLENPLCRSGLSQAEVTENEEYHHHEANNVDEVVHVASSLSFA